MRLVSFLLRIEGIAIFAASTWAYFARADGSAVVYALLLLAPDVSMVGYLRNSGWGAWTYDLVHNEALPLALLIGGIVGGSGALVGVALILAAHVGMDRAFGFGLKFPTHFTDTHLQRIASRPR